MLDKESRKATKNWLKNHVLLGLFGNLEGNTVLYDEKSGNWSISIQVGFKIPNGMEYVENGMKKDIMKEGIQRFLFSKTEHMLLKLNEYFGATLEEGKEEDYNLTYIFPPCMIATAENGFYRLRTKEEVKEIGERSPSLIDMIERDFELLEEGYYEFIPGTPSEEYEIDAFRLKKYSHLRARYQFHIPHLRLHEFDVEKVEPIFTSRHDEGLETKEVETVA